MNKKNSLILALDVLSRDKALELTEQLVDHFDAIKVGYPLILHAGLGIVEEISSISPVIADLKIADTPNTNRLICEAVLGAGADAIIAQAFPGKKAGKPGAVAKERQSGKNRLRNLRQGSSIPGCEEAPVMLSDRA